MRVAHVACLLFLSATVAVPASGQTVAIKAGKILTMDGPAIPHGLILISKGRVAAVGRNLAIPKGARVIDASGLVVMPGLVAPLTHLADAADAESMVSPQVRAFDSFDFYGDYEKLLAGGITSAYAATGPRRLVSGQGAVVKLSGKSQAKRTVLASADVRVVLGDLSKGAPALFRPPIPPTAENPILPAQRQLATIRPSQLAVLRLLFAEARAYTGRQMAQLGGAVSARSAQATGRRTPGNTIAQLQSSHQRLTVMPADPKLAALIPVITRQRPLRIVAHTAGDIRKALKFADDQRIDIVLEGATEAYQVAGEIAKRGVPVVLESSVRIGKPMTEDLTRRSAFGLARLDSAAIVSRAGVKVSLAPSEDGDLPDLLVLAAYQVQAGATRDAALRMVTRNSAEALGVGRRLGAIRVGSDADFAVLTGHPLDSRSLVAMTIVGGETAYKRTSAGTSAGAFAIRAGRILTATHGEIRNGAIIVRNGKIDSISRDGIVPAGIKVIESPNGVVMPGMIDLHSHLGLHADMDPSPLQPPAATTGSATGRTRLVNSLMKNDPAFRQALRGGVTTALVAPPTSGAICGQSTLIKTDGTAQVVKDLAAICFNVQGGAPRMSQIWSFRETVQRAKDYLLRRSRYEQERKNWERDVKEAEAQKKTPPAEPAEVQKDEDQEPFGPLLRKEIPALVHANRADEINAALTLFKDESDIDVVVMDAADGHRATGAIQKRNVSASIGSSTTRMENGKLINNPDILARAGVSVSFHSSATSGSELLRTNAAYSVRHGMDPADALRALTINAARALNVQNRLGSIEAGKDADLVILSGDPFDITSRVLRVFVNGKEAYRGK